MEFLGEDSRMGRGKWKRKRKIFNLHVEKDAGVLSRGYSFHRFDWFARKLLPARYQRPADCKNSRNDESGGGDERREKEKKKWQQRIYRLAYRNRAWNCEIFGCCNVIVKMLDHLFRETSSPFPNSPFISLSLFFFLFLAHSVSSFVLRFHPRTSPTR